jgi:hypothetical protein
MHVVAVSSFLRQKSHNRACNENAGSYIGIRAVNGPREPLLQILNGRDRLIVVLKLLLEPAQPLVVLLWIADFDSAADELGNGRSSALHSSPSLVSTSFGSPLLVWIGLARVDLGIHLVIRLAGARGAGRGVLVTEVHPIFIGARITRIGALVIRVRPLGRVGIGGGFVDAVVRVARL